MTKKKKKIVKVFIVDDSAFIRERLRIMLLELKDIEVIGQANNPQEAIKAIPKLKPDVVILDIRMPGGNGIDVLKNIKKDRDSPLVIMFTNYPYPQYRKKCKDAGADFFFDKSTEFEKVTDVLKKLIKNL
jgi:DNA-binding NarL/FixJ family response regulator